jgi:hypothetical protein
MTFPTLVLPVLLLSVGALASAQQSYWPLAPGARWELKSNNQTMAYEVVRVDRDVYEVRWDNPWVKATFFFKVSGNQIYLDTLDMGQGGMNMPPGTTYFDFGLEQGRSWSNVLGTMTVLRRGQAVNTPSGRFDDTVSIRARDKKNTDTFWTFAAGTGPVQFGEGKWAFYLSSYRPGTTTAPENEANVNRGDRRDRRAGGRNQVPSRQQPAAATGKVLIGIDANPATNEGYGDDAKLKRARMARQSGATFLYYAPKWNELEPNTGKYNFKELDHKVRVAEENNWPIALNLRVVDTNNRAMPGNARGWGFDDRKTIDQLREILNRIGPRFNGRVKWIQIGNEVNEYFKSKKGEMTAYKRMLEQVMPDLKRVFPGAQFSINFTFFAAPMLHREYGELLSLCDFVSFTYYPLNSDLTFRPPSDVPGDMATMVRAAENKPVFLQEMGYSSSPTLNSSEDVQAEFIRQAFAELRRYSNQIFAAHFVWMSDLPDSVVDDFTKYYRMPNSANFRAYLATLGYFDKNGRPKKAWHAFEQEALRMR